MDLLYNTSTISATGSEKRFLATDMAATTALREALNNGISSGSLIDTKIVLYSHRDSSGRVCRPKVLYTTSHVLKTVPYFNDRECTSTFDHHLSSTSWDCFQVLFGNFAESQSKDFEEAVDEEDIAEDYGYISDSDLEDGGDERVTSPKDSKKSKGYSFNLSGEDKVVCEGHEERVEKGKVVEIPDIAFVT